MIFCLDSKFYFLSKIPFRFNLTNKFRTVRFDFTIIFEFDGGIYYLFFKKKKKEYMTYLDSLKYNVFEII